MFWLQRRKHFKGVSQEIKEVSLGLHEIDVGLRRGQEGNNVGL